MVSNLSMSGIIFSLLVSFLLPIGLIIYARKKYYAHFSTIAVGALIFVLFVPILESLFHSYIFTLNQTTKALMENAWMFAIYGGLAPGIFEESGRLIAFKFLLKKRHEWKDGLAYGIGHGGIEAILMVGLTEINNLVYSLAINKGSFYSLTNSKLSANTIEHLKNSLINIHWYMFFVGGIERCFVIPFHIGLSILVLYAVKKRKYIYYLLAILIHALVDFPAGFVQKGVFNIWVVEVVAFIACIIAIWWIIKSKKLFNTDNDADNVLVSN